MMIVNSTANSGLSLSIVEGGFTLLAVTATFLAPRLGARFFTSIERRFVPLAGNKPLAVAFVGFAGLLLRLAILPFVPEPLPFIPDDFSFLLAADTFAHGRLTNPTPAMWTHFETIHVSMTPTYMSMYFPAQGLLLAAGKLLFGHPWFAVLIATAIMSAAICWMLQAWMPPAWAFLGGMIAVVHLGLFTYWVNTFTGGAQIAAIGGALVLGAFPRLMKRTLWRYSLLLGVGFMLMACTRPYEGVLLSVPVCVVLARWVFGRTRAGLTRPRPPVGVLFSRAAVPVALIAATLAAMGYYDYRVFGNPLKLPYTVNRAQYAVAPYYVWQAQRPDPGYRHKEMRQFYYENELPIYQKIHDPAGFLPHTFTKFLQTLLFFGGFALLPPLIMARRVFLDRRMRFLTMSLLVLMAGMLIEIYLIPHYLAPFTAVFYAFGLQAMRHLRLWKPDGKPVGVTWIRVLLSIVLVMACLRVFAAPRYFRLAQVPAGEWNILWYGPGHFGTARAAIQSQLENSPGKQLAIVRYADDRNLLDEWVYNSADIDSSKVVWAREMDAQNNEELFRYYKDRKVWLVQPDAQPAGLTPYPAPAVVENSAGETAR